MGRAEQEAEERRAAQTAAKTAQHDSDCAQHNEPAMPAGDCDCSAKEHDGLPVAGYQKQSQEAVDLVNENKEAEERLLRLIDDLGNGRSSTGELFAADPRWLAIARTDLERGFMALNRAIFKPARVILPEDGIEPKPQQ
ncbi:hypothetical protein STRZYGA_00540 [Brevundimonas phage vB_BpoS-Strzyga]|nr:hypothetical protein STRZYGA_00540 [Brevundimonas phage vB_BpoS-Strzyga]